MQDGAADEPRNQMEQQMNKVTMEQSSRRTEENRDRAPDERRNGGAEYRNNEDEDGESIRSIGGRCGGRTVKRSMV